MLNQAATTIQKHGLKNDYIERTYAGWLGKVIGVRHGANVENWSYEKLQRAFGEITGYLHEFRNFAADDDTNGPLFFLRALEDYTHTREITPEQIGLTWLNYAADGHGFYWWGGYGVSTEHTAYVNMKNGVMAPRSGSIEQNGVAVAEQIGGQIFIDVWGMIAPGNPELAAEYAEKAASVSHDGEGIYGGRFIAAAIAAAYTAGSIDEIIYAGLAVIPEGCEYRRMVNAVRAFHLEHPDNWRDCFLYVKYNFGYDKYPGHCHIIPNSAVIILSMLYGEGDFSRTINICNMCGWDTDCNVGNVGAILGVWAGLDGIGMEWRKPINDFLCNSSVIGSLNILDLPWCAAYISRFGYLIAGEPMPEQWESILLGKGARFHFEYPGSTHAMRTGSSDETHVTSFIENTTEQAFAGCRSLKVVFDKVQGGHAYRLYHQTYYRPGDFNDSRYDPSFSPILYPGQSISAQLLLPEGSPVPVKAAMYVMDGNSSERCYGNFVELIPGQWLEARFDIPFRSGACLEEAGIELIPLDGWVSELVVYVDDFTFSGKPNYEVDFSKERLEVWNSMHTEISQFTYLRGLWTLEDGELSGSYPSESAECYTGDLAWTDYRMEAELIPKFGDGHYMLFRVQGGIRSYAVGLAPGGKLALLKNSNGYEGLAEVEFPWRAEQAYRIAVTAKGSLISVEWGGEVILTFDDQTQPYLNGGVGFATMNGSHTHYTRFGVKGV
ncbi:ADP-ribosylglycohydrolase family protein [Paenibacillus paeoniae]|uniref:ADP-ribosylglycohydrolase family protein n=1 Tax=Paenibacillus paeoniae TaxID=2292705 RepID=A0A371PI35_9BACL|nr:ADP-ribosylglycohydrolase family protein [Paenibacillus paeoniae]REK75868.1 ADP-ribosylglycohydrolase family protein [Paenibacillus paeoniae]